MAQIEASQQDIKLTSYFCHNCNSSNCLTIKRHRINNIDSIQMWTCNKCGFKWMVFVPLAIRYIFYKFVHV
jgi:transposase-like protein